MGLGHTQVGKGGVRAQDRNNFRLTGSAVYLPRSRVGWEGRCVDITGPGGVYLIPWKVESHWGFWIPLRLRCQRCWRRLLTCVGQPRKGRRKHHLSKLYFRAAKMSRFVSLGWKCEKPIDELGVCKFRDCHFLLLGKAVRLSTEEEAVYQRTVEAPSQCVFLRPNLPSSLERGKIWLPVQGQRLNR